ncbi:hypothetical protein Barb6XT_02366 [Bacteroidales bacterium Barb6XT]|nr:hypothetical protein Barb6XT_02366 [Bacteroidales bacterium Barb6XT]
MQHIYILSSFQDTLGSIFLNPVILPLVFYFFQIQASYYLLMSFFYIVCPRIFSD